MCGDLNHHFYKDLVYKSRLIFPVGIVVDTVEANVTIQPHVPYNVDATARARRSYIKNKKSLYLRWYRDDKFYSFSKWIVCIDPSTKFV